MKQILIVESDMTNRPASKFFQGLAAIMGDRFTVNQALYVEWDDDELAVMIERVLLAAGIEKRELTKAPPALPLPPAQGVPAAQHEELEAPGGLSRLVQIAMEQIAGPDPRDGEEIEQRAKGKRARKGAPAKDREADAKPEEAVEGKCEICGEPVSGKRSKLCGSKDCKKAWNRVYQREYARAHARKKGEERKPSDADAEQEVPNEVEAFEQTLAAEMAAEGLPDTVELPEATGDEEPTLPGEVEEADSASWSWLIEDGPRSGTRLTNKQIVRLLMRGNLKTGQHIRHNRLGQCEVMKGKPPMQKLKQLYGAGAPRFILPAEIIA